MNIQGTCSSVTIQITYAKVNNHNNSNSGTGRYHQHRHQLQQQQQQQHGSLLGHNNYNNHNNKFSNVAAPTTMSPLKSWMKNKSSGSTSSSTSSSSSSLPSLVQQKSILKETSSNGGYFADKLSVDKSNKSSNRRVRIFLESEQTLI